MASSPPSESVAALGALLEAGRALHTAVDALDAAVANELGLHRNDLRCLNLLEHGPLSAGDIGRALLLSSGAVTALIDRLERLGFAERLPDPSDRRGVRVGLTAPSFARVGALYRGVALRLAQHFADRPAEEIAAAAAAVRRFAAVFAEGAAAIRQDGAA